MRNPGKQEEYFFPAFLIAIRGFNLPLIITKSVKLVHYRRGARFIIAQVFHPSQPGAPSTTKKPGP
jgi:hypothetical protein